MPLIPKREAGEVMPRYSDTDKAIAIEVIKRRGGNPHEALDEVREVIDAPRLAQSTLYLWWQERGDSEQSEPEKKEVIRQKWIDKTLDQYFEDVARIYLARATQIDAIRDTRGKDAVMTAAIAVDKMRLLRDLPTEIIGILPGLVVSIEKAGYDPQQVLKQLKDKFDGVYQ